VDKLLVVVVWGSGGVFEVVEGGGVFGFVTGGEVVVFGFFDFFVVENGFVVTVGGTLVDRERGGVWGGRWLPSAAVVASVVTAVVGHGCGVWVGWVMGVS
jgi:hypothetical protein